MLLRCWNFNNMRECPPIYQERFVTKSPIQVLACLARFGIRPNAADCSIPIIEESHTGLTDTTYTTGTLTNGIYYVCVTARDDNNRTTVATNNGFSFEIAYVPPKTHTIFVTSIATDVDPSESFPPLYPSWGGFDAADWTCTYHAYLGGSIPGWDGLAIVYQAVISTGVENAQDRLLIEGAILNTAGQTVADSAADFWSGTLQTGITCDENGLAVSADSPVWTGTFADGTHAGASCGAWNELTGIGTVGRSNHTGSVWTASHDQSCNESARLYCLSPGQ